MSSVHSLAAGYNAHIAASGRAGEIEWIVTDGGYLKLIYTERLERENGLRIKSMAERERRRAQWRQTRAADDRSQEAAAQEHLF